MKTVMKKMFCLMLVAVMLVGVMPFQASAASAGHVDVYIFDESTGEQLDVKDVPAGTCNLENLCPTGKVLSFAQLCHDTNHPNHEGIGEYPGYANEGQCVHMYVAAAPAQPDPAVVCPDCGVSYTGTHACEKATCAVCKAEYIVAKGHSGCPGPATVYVQINNTISDGSFTINAGNNADAVFAAYKASSLAAKRANGTVEGPIVTEADMTTRLSGNTVAGATYYLWLTWTENAPPATQPPTGNTAACAVYYNKNVNGSDKIFFKAYNAGTSMATVLAELNSQDITYPFGRTPDWFYIEGWYRDRDCKYRIDPTATVTGDTVLYAKWVQKQKYSVTLWMYTNGSYTNAVPVDIFAYAQDGWVTLNEVSTEVHKHFKPNTTAGLILYGPFDAAGWEDYRFYNNRQNGSLQIKIDTTKENNIYVMVHNVLIKGNNTNGSKADSSNPKTGDMIMMPVAVLGLSASALAVAFYLNKKKRVM